MRPQHLGLQKLFSLISDKPHSHSASRLLHFDLMTVSSPGRHLCLDLNTFILSAAILL
jgi:hypothetical protein